MVTETLYMVSVPDGVPQILVNSEGTWTLTVGGAEYGISMASPLAPDSTTVIYYELRVMR